MRRSLVNQVIRLSNRKPGHSSYILLDVLIGMYRPGYGGISVVFLCVSLSHDAEPKYKGLRNQGSTDYLNSVLQVLFMTKEFRDAVQSESSHTSYIDADLKDLFLQLKTSSPTTEYIICKLGIENVMKQQDAAQYFEKILSLASPEASQVFHGRLIHRTSCLCGESTDEHNSFWTLNLPINNTHNGVYNVEDGLKQFFSQSKLTGENQVYCDECKAKADTTTECEVGLYPKVLVLLLKRFEFSYYEMDYVKNNCPVDVPLNIDIPKGVSYELYATVDHVGDLRGGHYTATIQPADDGGCWYDFNDSWVTPKNNFNPIKYVNFF
uniref:USP domain-containing protein n=1 Tax=Gadus morhua TaxID=8049 RepID=A0A8C5C5Q2_GADMO